MKKANIFIKRYISIYLIISSFISTSLNNDIILLYSNIILKFNNSGSNKIFNRVQSLPDEIKINEKKQPTIDNTYYFNESEANNKVELIWNQTITTTEKMFRECSNITEIDLSNFDTSSVESMGYMFYGCLSLISINLNNLDTSNVRIMYYMFQDCNSLISLDLSNFNTFKVERMDGMFNGCSSLTFLNLSSFITSKTDNMAYIFYNCKSLTSLDLSNFDISVLTDMRYLFQYCEKLYYLNLKKAKIISSASPTDIFYSNSEKLILCCSDEKWKNFLQENNKYSIYIYCIDSSNYEFKCYKHDDNNNIYENICELCGKDYYQNNSDDSFFYCYQPRKYDYTIITTDTIKNNIINTTDIIINNISEAIIIKKEELIKNYKNINDSDIEKSIEGENNILLALTTTNNQKKNEVKNKSTINLGECEFKLKDNYNISYNDSLYIIKLDVKIKEMKIPKIEYEVYYPLNNTELIILNLSICENSKIDISIPIILDDNLDKYNPKSEYYNNICSKTTSESGTDISLKDRKNNFIDNNMTLCEENCEFIDYNNINKKVKCSCDVKIKFPLIEEIIFDKNKLYKSFTDIKNIINIKIIKCYKNVFKIESLIRNYGFFIFISIFVLYFICLFLFYFKYYYNIINIINEIFKAKNNNLDLKNENKNEKHNHHNSIRRYKRRKKNNKYNLKTEKNDKNEINLKNNFPPKKIKHKNKIEKIKLNSNNNYDYETISKNKMINKENNINFNLQNRKYSVSNEILNYNDFDVNSLSYKKALLYDKRTFIEYYISLLKEDNLLIFSFYCGIQDYNLQIIKIFLFFFFLSMNMTINALFFNDDTLHKIYEDEGNYNFVYQIPQIIYSSLISVFINSLIKYLSLSQNDVLKIKKQKLKGNLDIKPEKILKIIKIKYALFFIITFLFLLSFLYYITCFCGIYVNTQIHLIKDSIISFCLDILYSFCICLIPGIFRIPALRAKKKNKKYLYNFSNIIQII